MKKIISALSLLTLVACTKNAPMERHMESRFGKVNDIVYKEGLYFYNPISTDILRVSTAVQSVEKNVEMYSSDLQPVKAKIRFQFNVPDSAVKDVLIKYKGDVVDEFVIPRIEETLKEVSSAKTAENIVKQRGDMKQKIIEISRSKLNGMVVLDDVVIENIDLSASLEKAIESKMVQEQEAEKAKFNQEQAKIDAQTKIIRAEAEAKAAEILGKAISDNPRIIEIETVKKWNGVLPQVTGSNSNLMINLPTKK
jgi:prohibitin 2